MNMTQLEYFLTICKYNSISKAATQLFISQPALSQQLIRLEKELGAALFIRRDNSLMLTEIGENFQETAKRILFEYNNSKSMIDDIRRYRDPAEQVGHLSVAVTKTKSFIILAYILPAFKAQYPNISIDIMEVDSYGVEELIDNGSVDLGFCFGQQHASIKYEMVFEEPVLLAIPQKSPLGQKYLNTGKNIPFEDFKNEQFIIGTTGHLRDLAFDLFQSHNCEPHIIMETANPNLCHLLVATNIGCAFIGSLSSLITPTHADIPVYCQLDPNLTQNICIGYHVNKYVTRPMRSFIECAREKMNSMEW